jgi:hypothetical protein
MSDTLKKIEILHVGFAAVRPCEEWLEVIELTKDPAYAEEVAGRFPDREVRKVFCLGDPVDVTQEEYDTYMERPEK